MDELKLPVARNNSVELAGHPMYSHNGMRDSGKRRRGGLCVFVIITVGVPTLRL